MRTIGDGVGAPAPRGRGGEAASFEPVGAGALFGAGELTLAMMTTHGALDRGAAHAGAGRLRRVRQRGAPARRGRLRRRRPRAALRAPAGQGAAARLLALVLGRV